MKCTYDKCTEEEVCDNFLDEWGPKQIDMNIWGWLWLTESHLVDILLAGINTNVEIKIC